MVSHGSAGDGVAVVERKVQARSCKDGKAVSEGNGRALRVLARMCGAWQSGIAMDR